MTLNRNKYNAHIFSLMFELLTFLCLLNIHRRNIVNINLVIDRFAKKRSNKHINFVIYYSSLIILFVLKEEI